MQKWRGGNVVDTLIKLIRCGSDMTLYVLLTHDKTIEYDNLY